MTNAHQYVISCDIGTTGLKVGLFTGEGTLIRSASREQPLFMPAPGVYEQSPEGSWKLITEAVREAMAGSDPARVKGISITAQRGTAIALDPEGKPLTPLIIWFDKRCLPYVDWVKERVGADRYYRTAGHGIVIYGGIARVMWLRWMAPEVWERAAVISPPQTYFLKRLGCRDLVCDVSVGGFFFPMDIEKQTWSETLAAQLEYPLDKLPRLVHATDVVGELSPEAANELGLRPGIALIAGGGDGQLSGVGSGAILPGRVMVNLGTGAGVQTFLPEVRLDPGLTLNCGAHVVTGAWEMEGHTQASGASFRWLRDSLGAMELAIERESALNAYTLLISQAAQAPAGAEGLLFLPTMNGCSAPMVDLNASGCFLGLSTRHTKGHIIRAVLEGISLELRWMLDAMIEAGTRADEIRLVGGGSRDPFWNQIHADILGRPIKVLSLSDAAMVGGGMCAAVGLGLVDWKTAAEQFVQIAGQVEPSPNSETIYPVLYDTYKESFRVLSREGIFARLKNGLTVG